MRKTGMDGTFMKKMIESLVKLLSIEEKISLLAGVDFWHTAAIPRLGIPAIKVTDGPYGARTMADGKLDITYPATCFPTGVAMAASWDMDLIKRIGETLGDETKERACAVLLGPCVNIHRSPLGGRNFESFSEDPFLSSSMAVAFVKGVQSRQVGVSVKHFALNNQEFERFSMSSEAGERAMREIYFPSFEKVVKESLPWTVMCSYNKLNGTHASENKRLLTDILKTEWGFDGLVMSDWFATHSVIPAAEAGLDLEMPGPARFFGKDLLEAVKSGQIKEGLIDDKVLRILSVIQKSGAFEKPARTVNIKNIADRRKIAREAASNSFVLLKNENQVLPLNKNRIKTIAVIGPNAAVARIKGGGSSMVKPHYQISPLEGLKLFCRKNIKIRYQQGCRANRLTPVIATKFIRVDRSSVKPGLKAELFNNPDLKGEAALSRCDKQFSFRWFGDKPPGRRLSVNNFSARWSGYFRAPVTGRYKFGILTEGWARILINGKEVVSTCGQDNQAGFDISEEATGEHHLDAGSISPILIEYQKNPGQTSLTRSLRIGCELPLPQDMLQKAVDLASSSDVALVFAGLNEEWESEGFDRKDMEIPAPQPELIRAVAAANSRTVVVLNNGSPLAMSDWLRHVPAVLETWFPGQECGNAVAEVLFGRVNPSGKLPDTFPKKLSDNPAYPYYPGSNGKVFYSEDIFVGYRYYDKEQVEPLFPFGFGLSYTTFEYSNLQISPLKAVSGSKIRVKLDLQNSGNKTGKEVAQLYIRDVKSSLPRPPKELKGFQKVELKPGQKATLIFELGEEALSFYDPKHKGWIAEPGEFEVLVGSSSRDIRVKGRFQLK
jgi:beta-glucosidase